MEPLHNLMDQDEGDAPMTDQDRWIQQWTGEAPPGPAAWDNLLLEEALDTWANDEDQAEDELRQVAVERIKAWQLSAASNPDLPLDLSELNLKALPPLWPHNVKALSLQNNRIESYKGIPASLETLDIKNNNIISLREYLPPGLIHLDASYNNLEELPQEWPEAMKKLLLNNNNLLYFNTKLPKLLEAFSVRNNYISTIECTLPSKIRTLDLSDNQIVSMPEDLPQGATHLYIGKNPIEELPENLPLQMMEFNVSETEIEELPEDLHLRMAPNGLLDIRDNPDLEIMEIQDLQHNIAQSGRGVRLSHGSSPLSDDEDESDGPPPELSDVAETWLEDAAASGRWSGFAQEGGAQEFAAFLNRLSGTINNVAGSEFRETVAEHLQQAAERPNLREMFFSVAVGSTATCEDRDTLTWNNMQAARVAADAEEGMYDARLDELVGLGRTTFRLKELAKIAEEKCKELIEARRLRYEEDHLAGLVTPEGEETEKAKREEEDLYGYYEAIEVHLAYQVMLRDHLELSLVAKDMNYPDASQVTPEDIANALAEVHARESTHLADYLAADWPSFDNVLKRLDPAGYDTMMEELIEAMGEPFETRLAERLAEARMTGIPEAEGKLGVEVKNEIAREIKGAFMQKFLSDRGISL